MGNRSEAYDFALFEDRHGSALPQIEEQPQQQAAPRRQPQRAPRRRPRENVVELPQEGAKPAAKPQRHPLRFIVATVFFGVVFVTVLSVVQSQVLLTELTEEINNTASQLEEAQSLEIQLEMQAALLMNDAQVEQFAASRLGMSKISGAQVTYVNVAQEDQGTVLQDVDGGSLLDQLVAAVRSWFS